MAGARRPHSSANPTAGAPSSSVDQAEVDRFSAMAEAWWDPTGKFRPLHRFNPVRLGYIRDALLDHFGRTDKAGTAEPLKGLTLVDIGCGGGLVAEPMARLGAKVTAIDASDKNIVIAKAHATQAGLAIDYRATTAEDLLASGARFDVVLNMEVVEHVADRAGFLASSASLLKPGGIMIVATLNKTPKAFALAVVGAEYVLRWLPRGTHEWRKFVRPTELASDLAANGVELVEFIGVSYDPLADRWHLGPDLAVNYMGRFAKAA